MRPPAHRGIPWCTYNLPFVMLKSVSTGWESTFIEAGISATSAKIYAQTFSSEKIKRDSPNVLLYNCANEAIQNSIINTYPEFFKTSPNKLLGMHEVLVTRKSNSMVHQISFSSITQSDNEAIQNYVVWLWPEAWDCDFICPNCHPDLPYMYTKDKFIWGIANDTQ